MAIPPAFIRWIDSLWEWIEFNWVRDYSCNGIKVHDVSAGIVYTKSSHSKLSPIG